jgi:predicted MFS family arabinose efflux permease
VDLGFVKHKTFWMYQVPSIIQSCVAPVPSLWLPSFATSLGLPSTTGPLSIALLSLASCCGYLLQGRLVDRHHVSWIILFWTLGATISVFVLWGCGTHAATVYLFAIFFGLFGAGYPGHWTGCAQDMRRTSPDLNTGLVISLLCAGKGAGSIVAGPVSERLLATKPWQHIGLAYGTSYGAVIVFTGVCVFFGGAAAIPRLVKSIRPALSKTSRSLWHAGRTLRVFISARE